MLFVPILNCGSISIKCSFCILKISKKSLSSLFNPKHIIDWSKGRLYTAGTFKIIDTRYVVQKIWFRLGNRGTLAGLISFIAHVYILRCDDDPRSKWASCIYQVRTSDFKTHWKFTWIVSRGMRWFKWCYPAIVHRREWRGRSWFGSRLPESQMREKTQVFLALFFTLVTFW